MICPVLKINSFHLLWVLNFPNRNKRSSEESGIFRDRAHNIHRRYATCIQSGSAAHITPNILILVSSFFDRSTWRAIVNVTHWSSTRAHAKI